MAFGFSAEVPEGSGCIGSEGGKHVLRNGAKALFVICGGYSGVMKTMGNPGW